jgi:CheY-like chemotaxis protein
LSGPHALGAFDGQDFDLALVDLGMPDIDGWELSCQINQRRPDFPIPDFPMIVPAGWNVSVEDVTKQGARISAVLQKPSGMHELARAIEDALR